MQFHSITFRNYKVYLGQHTVQCSDFKSDQPLVLIGGETGAGKTSFLEGIKLCLYGKDNPLMLKGFSYQQFLNDVHNKKAKKKGDGFSVSIEYKTSQMREIDTYKIERNWKYSKGSYKENLILSINGDIVESIDQSDYQDEIDETFPAGVGDLLFFDSENFNKIPDFLENGFFDSLNKFLGINVYRQLSDDLSTLKRYHINMLDPKHSQRFEELNLVNEELNSKIKSLEQKKVQIKKDISNFSSGIKKTTKKLQKISGDLALKQEEIAHTKENLSDEMMKLSTERKDLFSNEIPFFLAKDLFNQLISSLEDEKIIKNQKAIDKSLSNFKKNFFEKLDSKLENKTIDVIKSSWEQTSVASKNKRKKIIHDISDSELMNIVKIFKDISSNTGKKLDKNNNDIRVNRSKMSNISAAEKSVDAKGVGAKYFYEIKELEKQISLKREKWDTLTSDQAIFQNELEKNEAEYLSLEKKIKLNKTEKKKTDLIHNTKDLLMEFSTYLSENRFSSFREYFIQTIQNIATKKDLVSDIRIDQENRIIQFLDKSNNPLSTKDFSAGESQVVAFSLMWAVNVSTKKYFPIVTDSPFNRLDKDHRKNFIENILKKSNHQFIFLSTNEEIGNTKKLEIDKYISDTYLIEYDKKSKTSSFAKRYFKA